MGAIVEVNTEATDGDLPNDGLDDISLIERLASVLSYTVGENNKEPAIDREEIRGVIQNKIMELVKKL